MFGWLGNLLGDVAQGDFLLVVAILLLVSHIVWRVYYRWLSRDRQPRHPRLFGLAFQLGLTLGMERMYEFSRAHVVISQLTAKAYSNGYGVMNFEISHGIFFEQRLERFFLPDTLFIHAIDIFYGLAHLLVTVGFLVWLYMRRNESFAFVRNMLYLTTAIALVVYMTFPTAPPRMFTTWGFVDPSKYLGFRGPGGTEPSSYMYNPFAAMPSLHLTYALIVGVTLVVVGRRWWIRAIGAVYPLAMLFAILVSANHWIMDAVGAVIVVVASAIILTAANSAVSGMKSLRLT